MLDACKSVLTQGSRWLECNGKALLRTAVGKQPLVIQKEYLDVEKYVQPLLSLLASVNYAKMLSLYQSKDFEGFKNLYFDGSRTYINSGKLDALIPPKYLELYTDLKPLMLRYCDF